MALPLSRNTTYSPNAPVKSNDLNDVQDCVIAGKHGARTLTYGAAAFQPAYASLFNLTDGATVMTIGGGGIAAAELDLHLPVGTKLTAITVYGSNPTAGVANLKIAARDVTSSGAPTTIASGTMAAGAAYGGVVLAVADRVIAAHERIYVQVSLSVNGFVLGGLVAQCTKE